MKTAGPFMCPNTSAEQDKHHICLILKLSKTSEQFVLLMLIAIIPLIHHEAGQVGEDEAAMTKCSFHSIYCSLSSHPKEESMVDIRTRLGPHDPRCLLLSSTSKTL